MDKNLTIVEIRIKFLRDLKGLTQTELAKKLNITQALVNSWEHGYANISLKKLINLSYFYQVPLDYILGLTNSFKHEHYTFINKLDLKYLGGKIRLIRKSNDLTQEEFATKLNTKRSSISYYENGKMTMSSADLKDICDTFGFSADWCCGTTKECFRHKPKIKVKPEDEKAFISI